MTDTKFKSRTHAKPKPSEGLKVVVLTFDTRTGDQVRERTIEYDSPAERRWLASHVLWSMHNGMSVETMNLTDYKRIQREAADK